MINFNILFEQKYDIGKYLATHPGGEEVLERNRDKDITEVLLAQAAHKSVLKFIRNKLATMEVKEILTDSKAFFEKITPFVKPDVDGRVATDTFLKAANCIVQFVELLGKTFLPVKLDVEGNITKLLQILLSDPAKYEFLDNIVTTEKAELPESELHVGTDALTWLNRALVYNQLFLDAFYKDYLQTDTEDKQKQLPEDMSAHFKNAYNQSLKKHHGWIVQNVFRLCILAAPSRQTFLKHLGYVFDDLQESRERILKDFGDYLDALKSNTEAISLLLFKEGYQP